MAYKDLHFLKGPNGYYYITAEGAQGTPGRDGTDGVSHYFYLAFASDSTGANLSFTPANGLTWIAFIHSTEEHTEEELRLLFAEDDVLWQQYIGELTQEQLQRALATKADTSHTHSFDEIVNGYDMTLQEVNDFVQSQISNLENDVFGLQNSKADTGHTHKKSDITDLTAALNDKAALSHSHTQSQITGLTAALNAKADASHTHSQSDVTGLEKALADKASQANLETLQALVNAKASQTDLETLQAQVNAGHIHPISDILGLQDELARKMDEPDGGTAGQVLTKTEIGTKWADPEGGVVLFFELDEDDNLILTQTGGDFTFDIDEDGNLVLSATSGN